MVGGVVETSSDDVDCSGGNKRPGDESSDDLSLRSGERDGEEIGDGRGQGGTRRRREKSGGDGEEIELAVESDG